MTGAIVLATDPTYLVAPTAVAGLLVLLQFAGLWYAVPLRRRAHLNRR